MQQPGAEPRNKKDRITGAFCYTLLYMSKLIAVRLPDNLEETLRGNAAATGQTISQIVIQGLEMVLFRVHFAASTPVGKPLHLKTPERWKSLPPPKVAHAENCKCLICKPPKP